MIIFMSNMHVFSILTQLQIGPPDRPEMAHGYEGLPVA
jgi:hypothetical protein